MTAPAPAPGQAAVPLAELSDQEKLIALVRAAKTYDHENRPQASNWGSVSDHQVARLILGALGALEPKPAPELGAAMAETRAMRELVDEATSAVLARARQFLPAPLVKQLRSIRERAGLPS